MIFGIGTDVVQLSRVETVYARHGEHFVRRLLLPEEEAAFRRYKRRQGSDCEGARHRLRARHLDP
jgi:phosphopantetheinyl transferase (holo-ACP synthase)